jgi:hypothetical protein
VYTIAFNKFPHQSQEGFLFTNAKAQAPRQLEEQSMPKPRFPKPNLDQILGTNNSTGWVCGSGQALPLPAVL